MGSANASFLRIDSDLRQICVTGQVESVDAHSGLDTTVRFSYSSAGAVDKRNGSKVRGEFAAVLLTLDISGSEPYRQTITADCKLKASLLKRGSRDKVRVRCDLGENFSAFPGISVANLRSIDSAYAKEKRARARAKNGKLRISSVGVPSEAASPATCELSKPR
jgi:hypothetical protein